MIVLRKPHSHWEALYQERPTRCLNKFFRAPAFGMAMAIAFSICLPLRAQNTVSPQGTPNWQPQLVPYGALHPQQSPPPATSTSLPPSAVLPSSVASSPSRQDSSNLPASSLQLPAHKAMVRLGAGGLYVKAENSNLSQILHDISAETGTRVSGLAGEERIFGTYGPGTVNEVMDALLYGSDYNVMMVGSIKAGAPRELVLTRRSNAPQPSGAAAPSTRSDDDVEGGTPYEDQEERQQPIPSAMGPSGPGPGMGRNQQPPGQNALPSTSPDEPLRTPQQLLEQLQQLHQQNGQQPNAQGTSPQQ